MGIKVSLRSLERELTQQRKTRHCRQKEKQRHTKALRLGQHETRRHRENKMCGAQRKEGSVEQRRGGQEFVSPSGRAHVSCKEVVFGKLSGSQAEEG